VDTWTETRLAELSQEIRNYPGPIAGCDEHLPALLEERARILSQIKRESCSPEALWTNDGGFNAA